mgnify:FL=1
MMLTHPMLVISYALIRVLLLAPLLVLTLLLGPLLPMNTYAQDQDDGLKAFSLKAAYIYSFSKFVEWPVNSFSNNKSPLVLCIINSHEPRDAWEIIDGKTTQGRQLSIQYLESTDLLQPCHMLFIGNKPFQSLKTILPQLAGRAVLTLGDHDAFTEEGGMIGLTVKNDRVFFSINLASSKQAGLIISSRLIALASQVVGG